MSQSNTDHLLPFHRNELLTESAISDDVVAERGYVTVDRPNTLNDNQVIPGFPHVGTTRDILKRLGFPGWAVAEDYYFPGLLIPMYSPSGEKTAGQFKPKNAVANREGKRLRYASIKGGARLDVHPRWTIGAGDRVVPPIKDATVPLWITEGVKKGDALTSRGVCTIALAGVYNWRSTLGALGDWEDVALKGREVTICFDADTITKPAVQGAMKRLGQWLRHKGVGRVRYLVVPAGVNGSAVKGVDDYFAAGGTLLELERAVTMSPPRAEITEDAFTDARLAQTIADDVLVGQFARVIGVGWRMWNGRRWTDVDDGETVEAVRQYALGQYADALESERARVVAGRAADPANDAEIEGWRKMQTAARIKAVLSLAGNVTGVPREAAEFDADPNVLNTPAGLYDFTTGALTGHDPDALCTKMTTANYRAGAADPAWTAALESVPAEAREWLRNRLGQAATGHMPDDERMALLAGGGSNGKTLIMDAVFKALGSYAELIPNTLLLASDSRNKGAATPEKMTLQGVRLAYVEETPEGRHLDINVVKEIVGTPSITGRQLYQKQITFGATHSLFLNTNHPPRVAETGHAEWRRLVRLDFPYRYVGVGEAIQHDTDRVGDPGLKKALTTPAAREAVLAWLIDGALAWYADPAVLSADPALVTEATATWRSDSDPILKWIEDDMVLDEAGWVIQGDAYAAFSVWLKAQGHQGMSQSVFLDRVGKHTALPRTVKLAHPKTRPELISKPRTQWLSEKSVSVRPRLIAGLRFSDQAF